MDDKEKKDEKNIGEFVYRPSKYDGPHLIDQKPSQECLDYHKNSKIQINLPDGFKYD